MNQGTVGRIEDWAASSFSGGFDGLRELEGMDFSGAVSANGAWLFMLNGRIVGVSGGSLDAFERAEGTVYEAPHPSLPLLFAMRERGGETRAKYYTDDTPLREVDQTLSDGGFTGYVELSENVLSGDYYVVYYGGESLSAAFIGSESRLVTGDEAFEMASDEVGIYEVRTVDLEVREVPGSTQSQADSTSAQTPAGTVDAEPGDQSEEPRSREDTAEPDEPRTEVPSETAEPETTNADRSAESEPAASEPPASESEPAASSPPPAESEPPTTEPQSADEDDPAGASSGASTRDVPSEPDRVEEDTGDDPSGAGRRPGEGRDAAEPASSSTGQPSEEDPFSEEEEWREARTIPSLDPDESDVEYRIEEAEQPSAQEPAGADEASQATQSQDPAAERVQELRAAIESYEARIEELERQLEEATSERDQLRQERDRLERRVRELESRADVDDGGTAGEAYDPGEALSGTDMFVRYGSKGQATLESAQTGGADRDAVNDNLRLETHTRFEEDAVTVDGRPFDEYLEGTLEHGFVRWVIEDLLYEIRDTANEGGLRDIYDAIPRIDRIEFDGTITSRDEEGEELRHAFDVVLRDRMGSPVIVADLNDGRDPATSEMLSELLERATRVADGQESLAGAFLVTASFFEPSALETADEATDGGLLNRDARKSFVKLSRKRGYHLCLAEARGDEFHVAVPEL